MTNSLKDLIIFVATLKWPKNSLITVDHCMSDPYLWTILKIRPPSLDYRAHHGSQTNILTSQFLKHGVIVKLSFWSDPFYVKSKEMSRFMKMGRSWIQIWSCPSVIESTSRCAFFCKWNDLEKIDSCSK